MQKITSCLWFDGQAEEAARLYVSLFPNSKVGAISHYSEVGPGEPGTPLTVEFELDGVRFTGLNGGPMFKFTEAVSFQIDCADQAEVDHYWHGLVAGGGEHSQCGWLKDRFGVSWQVIPRQLMQLISDPDKAKAARVMQAMLKMKKLIVADLEAAAAA